MGYASGTITQEELERYGGANIMLMNTRENIGSGEYNTGGSGEYRWSLTWTDDGFTTTNSWGGVVWDNSDILKDYSMLLPSMSNRDSYINENGPSIAQLLNGYVIRAEGCYTWEFIGH